MVYTVAIIGTGPDPDEKGPDGYAMAYRHAPGYRRLEECELVACADIVPENAEAFGEHFDLDGVYDDNERMLREVDPDIVSVCVPPAVHHEVVMTCADAGDPEAIHCEKPMATRWDDCTEMVGVCDREDVQLTIDHQRRLARPVAETRRLLEEGAIGDLRRLEWSEVNLFDAGSHLFDLCDHITDGASPEWVLAAVQPDPDNRWFGALNERQAIAQWEYDNGVQGLASTAEDESTAVDAYLRIVGEDGVIEINPDDGPPLRLRTDGGWTEVDTDGESIYGPGQSLVTAAANKLTDALPGIDGPDLSEPTHYERAIDHLVTCFEEGSEPLFSGRRVLRGTELVFASWESARRRERVDLPLEVDGNPLERLCEERGRESEDADATEADVASNTS